MKKRVSGARRVMRAERVKRNDATRQAKMKFLQKILTILLIILIVVIIIICIVLIVKKEKPAAPEEGLEGELKGKLASIGVLGRGDYVEAGSNIIKTNCSDKNLKEIWDFIFNESSNGITIVSDKDSSEICDNALMYKNLGGGETFFIILDYFEYNWIVRGGAYGFYGNFSDEFLAAMGNTTSYYLDSFLNEYVVEVLYSNYYVKGYRNISSVNQANEEYYKRFKVENGTWNDTGRLFYIRGSLAYTFQEINESEIWMKVALLYQNATLDFLEYIEEFQRPINLTQIEEIPTIDLEGSRVHHGEIELYEYFDNLGSDGNLSFSYALSKPGVLNVTLPDWGYDLEYYDYSIDFDTSSGWGGTLTMNITISHPNWSNGANVTSNNFDVIVLNCTDTDGGWDEYEKGTTTNSSVSRTDYCVSNTSVMEYRCWRAEVESYEDYCGWNYYCDDGRCIYNASVNLPPVFQSSCEDIDFDKNTNHILNMRSCFVDYDNDSLYFTYTNMSIVNISIVRNGTNLTLVPQNDFVGKGYFNLTANDNINAPTLGVVGAHVKEPSDDDDGDDGDDDGDDGCTSQSRNLTCGSWVCGVKKDDCDRNVVCGNCTAGKTCVNGACVIPATKITSSSPPGSEINITSNRSLVFSINAENYNVIEWYVDGALVKTNVSSYEVKNLSAGSYEIKAMVKKGSAMDYKIWRLNVSKVKSDDKKLLLYVFIGLIVLVVVVLVIIIIIKFSSKKAPSTTPSLFEVKEKPRDDFKKAFEKQAQPSYVVNR